MGKKEPFRLEKDFFLPFTPDELYAKAITSLKSKRKSGQTREFIIEEENPPHFIKFRFIHIYEFGDYKRSSSINITPQMNGSKVTISTPRAVNDDLSLSNIWVRDDMFILYEFLGGAVSDSILREIYSKGEVYRDFIVSLIFLVLFFGLALVLPYQIFTDNMLLGVIIALPFLFFTNVILSPMIEYVMKRVRVVKAFTSR
jgi:hypothetical protein